MFGLFKKRAKKKDPIQNPALEQAIADIAQHNQQQHYQHLHRLLTGQTLYLPVDPDSLPQGFKPGSSIVTNASHDIRIKNVPGPQGERFIPAATNALHPMLQDHYISMDWVEFLEMTVSIAEAAGALIQSQTAYIGLGKERIEQMLNKD